MAAEFLKADETPTSFFVSNATDYGCAGRGHFDFNSKTLGKLVDDADRAFYTWKKCIQCTGIGSLPQFKNQLPKYRFRKQECGEYSKNFNVIIKRTTYSNLMILGLSTELSRPICECDKQLIKQLRKLEPKNAQFPVSKCVKGSFRNPFAKIDRHSVHISI